MPEQISISVVSSGVNIAAGAVTSVTAGTGLTGGNITSSGTIAADFAASGSATANKVVEATDSRLSNARTPTTHGSSHGVSGSDPIPADGIAQSQVASLTSDLAAKVPTTRQVIAGTGLGGGGALSTDVTLSVSYGTSSTTACVGNDARLTNARTPDVHASTHTAAGSDPLTLSQSQITGLVASLSGKALAATQVIAGTGLTGGGDLTTDCTLAVAYGSTSTTATVGNDSRLSFIASGTGATTLTLQNKLRDVLSVKDFGALGDGSTDDTTAISNAITAAMGKTLFFPAGTYVLSQTGTNQISKTLSGNLTLKGDNAIIKAMPPTTVNQMLVFTQVNQYNVEASGLIFDANQKAQSILRFDNNTGTAGASTALMTIDNCEFKNCLGIVGGVGGQTGAIGLLIAGGYKRVSITNTRILNMNRLASSNVVGSTGTLGLGIIASSGLYCESANISGCLVADILNQETTGNSYNQDTDGISLFGGLNSAGSTYVPCSYTVTNNTFVNCKGRAIKIQSDEANISNNVFRFGIRPCASANTGISSFGGVVDFQVQAGNISNNVWHYDPAPGNTNPFSITNTAGDAGSRCITFYTSGSIPRPRSVTVNGNIIYNNVTEAVGAMLECFNTTEGSMPSGASALPMFVTFKENRMLGGACKYFLDTALRTSAAGTLYMTISDNAVSKIQTAFMCNPSSGSYDNNVIVCTNNINASGTDVLHLENTGTGTNYPAKITALNNVGIGLEADKTRTTTTAFLPRTGGVSPLESIGSQFSMQTVTLAAGADYTFPQRTYVANGGLRLITGTTFGGDVNAMFSGASGNLVQHFVGTTAVVIAATGAAGSTSNKIHIGQNGGLVQVRNTFGSSYIITLFSWG